MIPGKKPDGVSCEEVCLLTFAYETEGSRINNTSSNWLHAIERRLRGDQ